MPTDREKIEQWSLGYHLLKSYTDFCFKIYFRTKVIGLKKLPTGKSLIFAPNHQNSLIDALAVLSIKRWQPVFLARADVFKGKTLCKILTFFKILPVYRIRDGYQNLALNDDIFRKTLDVLKNRNGIGILPEGNHFGQRRLRTLKKGIARISFQAEDACNNELKIQIIPVGLNYSNYINLRSKLLIRLGEPIDVSKYLDLYRQNPAQAYNALIEELEISMKKEMIQIDDEVTYYEYESLREIFTPLYIKKNRLSCSQNSQFGVDKKMIAAVDGYKIKDMSGFDSLMNQVKEYSIKIKEAGLTYKSVQKSAFKLWSLIVKILILIATLPLFVYGYVNNFIPVAVAYKISKKIKDDQFISSIRFVVGMLLFPIAYLIQTLLFWAISGNGVYALNYLASLLIGAIIAYQWRKCYYNAVADLKWVKVILTKKELKNNLIDLDSLIGNTIERLM